MRKFSFLKIQYLTAPAVVAISLASGAITMAALAQGGTTAGAANSAPRTQNSYSRIVEKRFPVSKFTGIEALTAIEVVFTQGEATGYAEVSASEDMMPYVDICVENGVLNARYKGNPDGVTGKTVVKITAPEIENISTASAASVNVSGILSLTSPLKVSTTAASSVSFGEISGSSLQIEAVSASNVYALSVDMDHVEVSAASAADVKLRGMSVGSVDASAVSAASVTLSGRCNKVAVSEATGGEVKTRGLIRESMPITRDPNLRKASFRQP